MNFTFWTYLEIFSTLGFFVVVGLLLLRDRRRDKKSVEYHSGVVIRRMWRGREVIDLLVKRHKRAMELIGNFAVALSFCVSAFGLGYMILQTATLQEAFKLVLPSVTGVTIPGPVISVPFWYWIIVVFVVMASHETMHAIFARLEKIKLKNYGLLFLFVLPLGAFVEFDMNKVKRLKLMKKLRIFAAGSFGNLVVGLIVFLIGSGSVLAADWLITPCIKFNTTMEGTPAAAVGLSGCIYEIEDVRIRTITDLGNFLNDTAVGDTITITTTEGRFDITTIESPDIEGRAFVGIQNITVAFIYTENAEKFVAAGLVPEYMVGGLVVWLRLLQWLLLISLGVGIANLLPMKPFDGGLMLEEILFEVFKNREKAKSGAKLVSIFVAALLLTNIFMLGLIKTIIQILVG